ncbi:hypothetical protein [Agromyces silvae]|uniref:hypothetical protein n=1 Tax=Agromyces silvae TaxID=3388266 RepID=UPI00280AD80F|nr:hypothetical protein [Agromyces protaetiae]
MAFVAFILPATGLGDDVERAVFAGVSILTALYSGLLGALIWRNVARRVRIDRLASDNGLAYSAREPLARFAGTALVRPGRQVATDAVFPAFDPVLPVDFLAATFAPGSDPTARRVGFVQIGLDRPTPHIALVNRRSKVLRQTGSRVRADQRLRLEGGFDRTFTLYCPRDYERDALYIFTPDLMALLLDVASDCEIELIDGTLVAYVGRPWKLWRPDRFAAMLTLTAALAAKARRRTRTYVDERAAPGTVAATGRRLRLRPSAGSLLSLAAPVALGVFGVVTWLAG